MVSESGNDVLKPFRVVAGAAKEEILGHFREVVRLESDALRRLAETVDDAFYEALRLIATSPGKVVVTGVGKSGIIGRKIAATLTSTGTVATFLHPSDGLHGDVGVVTPQDVVIAIGKSGESEELTKLIPVVRRIGARLVAITAEPQSTLGRNADVVLHAPVEKEACPHNLAPTVSTTVTLAIGDALAVVLMKMKDFRSEDFARYHPGGKLGKRLLLKVRDLMIPAARCPVLDDGAATMEDVIFALGEYGLGVVLFCREGRLAGILTDGDIRRLLSAHRAKIFDIPVASVLNAGPLTIDGEFLAVEALRFMEDRPKPLNVVPVVEGGRLAGIVRLHDLLTVS